MASCEERSANFHDSQSVSSILNILHEQRNTCRFCDVILRVCDEEIYAHSNVLAATSPYFGLILGQGQDLPRAFSQMAPQIIDIRIDGSQGDCGYGEAVGKVVDYMYTRSIKLSSAILIPVMEIAKIMQMDQILRCCARFQNGEGDSNLSLHESSTAKIHSFDLASQTETCLQDAKKPGKKRGRKRKKIVESDSMNEVDLGINEISPSQPQEEPEVKETTGVVENIVNDQLSDIKAEDKNSLEDKEIKMEEPTMRDGPRTRGYRPITSTSAVFKCRGKKKNNKSKEDLELLMKIVPPEKVDNRYHCAECKYSTPMLNHYRRHSLVHSKGTYSCTFCSFSGLRQKELERHMTVHLHADFQCSFCFVKLADEEQFNAHMAKHDGNQPYFCSTCDLRFRTKAQLNLHLPKHSLDKPFVCPICKVGFKWKHAVKNHMTVHSTVKEYLCDVCGFATAHRSQIKAHSLIHSGKTFKCQFPDCDFEAIKRQNLKYHMLSHTHEKPHQCEVCGQRCSLVKNLKRHMKLHTNDRSCKCIHCGFSTTRDDKLKEHLLKQHSIGTVPSRKRRITDYHNINEYPEDAAKSDAIQEQIVTVIAPGNLSFPIAIPQDHDVTFTDVSGQTIQYITTQQTVN